MTLSSDPVSTRRAIFAAAVLVALSLCRPHYLHLAVLAIRTVLTPRCPHYISLFLPHCVVLTAPFSCIVRMVWTVPSLCPVMPNMVIMYITVPIQVAVLARIMVLYLPAFAPQTEYALQALFVGRAYQISVFYPRERAYGRSYIDG
ncbi:hypothetical protein F4861DRAFT_97959 [Xylaria intraflava]|nr:hypothetical protein F4861DRAFT_97959 [Xylaria intraflava]